MVNAHKLQTLHSMVTSHTPDTLQGESPLALVYLEEAQITLLQKLPAATAAAHSILAVQTLLGKFSIQSHTCTFHPPATLKHSFHKLRLKRSQRQDI